MKQYKEDLLLIQIEQMYQYTKNNLVQLLYKEFIRIKREEECLHNHDSKRASTNIYNFTLLLKLNFWLLLGDEDQLYKKTPR